MEQRFEIKSGDTLPVLRFKIWDNYMEGPFVFDDGGDVWSVDFVMHDMGGQEIVLTGTTSILNEIDAVVQHEFTAADTAIKGYYVGRFILTRNTEKLTVPQDDSLLVVVK